MSEPVTIIGAGYSGLITAFYLTEKGIPVRIYERSSKPGGLIQTKHSQYGIIETAANGFLNSARIEDLFTKLKIDMVYPKKESAARYVYRSRPKRWPLGFFETLGLLLRFVVRLILAKSTMRPKALETVNHWGERVFGKAATDYLLSPALQGIYAGDISKMSASLLWNSMTTRTHDKSHRRGLISARDGMGSVMLGLKNYLEERGVIFEFEKELKSHQGEIIVATNVKDAARFLHQARPEFSERLSKAEMLPLVSITCFFKKSPDKYKGFGILFPKDQGFRVKGVLFNECIFENRSSYHSETWIFGGATDTEAVLLSNEELNELILKERKKLFSSAEEIMDLSVQRWPESIPHYDLRLEEALSHGIDLPENLYLVGNYLGGIGLSKITEKANEVAERIAAKRNF